MAPLNRIPILYLLLSAVDALPRAEVSGGITRRDEPSHGGHGAPAAKPKNGTAVNGTMSSNQAKPKDLWEGSTLEAMYTALGFGVKVEHPKDATSLHQILETDSPIPGVRRVKIRSGPYKSPNMNRYSWVTGEHGMLWNFPDYNVDKPCTGHCTILKQFAGLEYANGTEAMIDSGMWLHHMIALVSGPTRWDPVCYDRWWSSPHFGIGSTSGRSERYFSSGNERMAFDFNPGGKDLSRGTGYHISPEDSFHYLVDFMNMNMEDKVVYLTMTYDVLDGPLPKGWNNTKIMWLDADNCGRSEIKPPQETGGFEIRGKPWKPNFEGKIISAFGHLHDGGTEIEVRSTNKSLCASKARYAETPQFKFTWGPMGGDQLAVDHISSMSDCIPRIDKLTKDQEWAVVGKYNYDEREGNLDHGKQSEIMAIALVVVAIPPEGVKAPWMVRQTMIS